MAAAMPGATSAWSCQGVESKRYWARLPFDEFGAVFERQETNRKLVRWDVVNLKDLPSAELSQLLNTDVCR